MYFEVLNETFDPNGGTIDKEILGIEGTYDDIRINDCQASPNIISSCVINHPSGWVISLTYSANSTDSPINNGNVTIYLDFITITYDDLTDPNHENPIEVTETKSISFDFIQSINVAPIDAPSISPSDQPASDDKITEAQSELSEGILDSDTKSELKKHIMIEKCGIEDARKSIVDGLHSDLEKLRKVESDIELLESEIDIEYKKKKYDESRIRSMNEKLDYYHEKLFSLMDSFNNTEHNPDYDYEKYIDDEYGYHGNPPESKYVNEEYERLKNSEKGMELDNEMANFNKSFDLVQKFVPDVVQSTATASIEPTTAVVVTPMGAGAVAANPLQSMGTLKRIKGQVMSLSPVLLDLLHQCRVLGLSGKVVDTLITIADVLSKVTPYLP